jgi:hypothetical protein
MGVLSSCVFSDVSRYYLTSSDVSLSMVKIIDCRSLTLLDIYAETVILKLRQKTSDDDN